MLALQLQSIGGAMTTIRGQDLSILLGTESHFFRLKDP